jgi:hypothetical protein
VFQAIALQGRVFAEILEPANLPILLSALLGLDLSALNYRAGEWVYLSHAMTDNDGESASSELFIGYAGPGPASKSTWKRQKSGSLEITSRGPRQNFARTISVIAGAGRFARLGGGHHAGRDDLRRH